MVAVSFAACVYVSVLECAGTCGVGHVCLHAHVVGVLQKQRVRGHSAASGDRLIERAQLPVCCTDFCSAWGRRMWTCDHVNMCVANTVSLSNGWVCRQVHLCCRVLSGVIPYDFAHTCVLQKA